MAYCSANGCNNSKRKESCRSKSFFKFPSKNPTILKTWVQMMNREHFDPGPSSVLCSDHFEEECFEYQNFTNRRQLKPGSIPTIFGFTKSPSSRRILDRCEPSTSAEINRSEPPVSNEANAAMATEEIQIEMCKMTSEEKSSNSSNKKFIEEIQSCLLEESDEKEGDQTVIDCQEAHFEDAYDIDDTEEIEEKDEDFPTEQSDTDSNYDYEDEKDCFMAFRKESGEIIDSMRWEKSPYFNNQRITKKYHFTGPSGVESPAKTANGILETWKCLFDDGMLDMIVMFTNQNIDLIRRNYIRVRDVPPTDATEIQAFIGLLYLSALYKTNLNLWDSDGFGVEIFRLTMSFKRFQFLCRVIRFDNTETSLERKSFDRLAPIRDLFEKFVLNCQSCYSVGEHVTLDEKLEPFRGKCSFLRYVPSKPGKYAIKIFTLVDTKTLYTSNMEIYSGKQPEGPYAVSNESLDVVNRMIAPISHSGRNVTATSWFGDVSVMKTLSEDHNLSFVGAIKKNKWQIPYRFKNMANRKVFSSIFAYRREGTLVSYVVQNEKNKNNILLISSKHLKGNIDKGMEDKKTPEMVSFYNQTNNAVDTVSKMCSTYNVARQTRRWPVVIFFSLLNTAGINSQILYLEKENKIISRREFLKCLGKELINDQLKQRAKISCLPQSISSRLHEILPKTEQLDDTDMVMGNTCDLNISRKRCRPCVQEKRDRKSRFSCYMCGSYLCLQHCGFVCQNGCPTRISIKQEKEW